MKQAIELAPFQICPSPLQHGVCRHSEGRRRGQGRRGQWERAAARPHAQRWAGRARRGRRGHRSHGGTQRGPRGLRNRTVMTEKLTLLRRKMSACLLFWWENGISHATFTPDIEEIT